MSDIWIPRHASFREGRSKKKTQNPFLPFGSLFIFSLGIFDFGKKKCLKEPSKLFFILLRVLKTPIFSVSLRCHFYSWICHITYHDRYGSDSVDFILIVFYRSGLEKYMKIKIISFWFLIISHSNVTYYKKMRYIY